MAFDLEAYNLSKYSQLTCLLQLSSNLGKEFVIDTLAPGVWDEVCGLAPLFADPTIVKVGHSIGGLDVRCLHRDFGIFICNAFDTYEASKVLNLPSHGLAGVCKYYGLAHSNDYTDLKNIYQTTDWRQRPLPKEMILYGRYDVHYLLELRLLMMRDLTHYELFTDDIAESKLVAESLAATLQKVYEFEDGDEFVQWGDGSAYFSVTDVQPDVRKNQNEPNRNEDSGDIDRNSDGFYTPKHSNSLEDLEGQTGGSIASHNLLVREENTIQDDDNENVKTTMLARADVLRVQPRLMRVIALSQERCRDLWSGRSEPYYRNPVFVSLMQRAKRQNQLKGEPLSKAQVQLYEDLVRLRSYVAQREECLPGFICSLNDLALIAAERPTSEDALRLINYFLPEILGSKTNNSFMKQIFVLTIKSLRIDGIKQSPADAAVFQLYSKNKRRKQPSFRATAWVAIASAVCGTAIFATVILLKRRRR